MNIPPTVEAPYAPAWPVRVVQFVIVALLVLLAAQGYELYLRNQAYSRGAEALKQGDWSTARAALWPVFRADSGFREVATLLEESYRRPAAEAIAARDWPAAAEAIVGLESLDLNAAKRETSTGGTNAHLAAALRAARLRAWSNGTLRLQHSFAVGPNSVIALSPDGRTLVASDSGDLLLWQLDQPEPQRLVGEAEFVVDIAWSADTTLLATVSPLKGVQLRSPDGAPQGEPFGEHTNQVAFSPHGQFIASSGIQGRIELRRVAVGGSPSLARGQAQPWLAQAYKSGDFEDQLRQEAPQHHPGLFPQRLEPR